MASELDLPPATNLTGSVTTETRLLNAANHDLPDDEASRALLVTANRLSLWQETALAAGVAEIKEGRPRTERPSRYGTLAASVIAADNQTRAQRFLDALAPGPDNSQPVGNTCQTQTITGLHDINHRRGLDTAPFPEEIGRAHV